MFIHDKKSTNSANTFRVATLLDLSSCSNIYQERKNKQKNFERNLKLILLPSEQIQRKRKLSLGALEHLKIEIIV